MCSLQCIPDFVSANAEHVQTADAFQITSHSTTAMLVCNVDVITCWCMRCILICILSEYAASARAG